MRARLHTLGRELGTVELAPDVTAVDVVRAVQGGRLFCTPIEEPLPASAATVPPADAAGAAAPPRRKGGQTAP